MSANVYIALVHHPVEARDGSTMTTAVTNLDVHDLARSARTYDVKRYFVVTPIDVQRQVVERILEHWDTGIGRRRVPERSEALERCRAVDSVESAIAQIVVAEGQEPLLIATAARSRGRTISTFSALRHQLSSDARPHLILFGTGHGLASPVLDRADYLLEPVEPNASYNHLSVRAASAIILDRLLGG